MASENNNIVFSKSSEEIQSYFEKNKGRRTKKVIVRESIKTKNMPEIWTKIRVMMGLPEDATMLMSYRDYLTTALVVIIHSQEWPVVPEYESSPGLKEVTV